MYKIYSCRGHDHWTSLKEDGTADIPDVYVKGWYVEAIDMAGSNILYEGLQNLRNLHYLKYLDISHCPLVDEWCMDRITGRFPRTVCVRVLLSHLKMEKLSDVLPSIVQ